MVNWRAMQIEGSKKMSNKSGTLARPSEVLPRYLVGGNWQADLSRDGKRRGK